ncbi:MAG TPA: serine/threonine-protein kinase [Polyangiaceae bacterium]|nr:serine/threonine-protein kinase [Polyangiaceae bacterium]
MAVGAPNQILSGKYRLERELGRGGMGSVWLAQHLTLRSPVAIKLIDPGIATNPEALSRFLREAQAAASLRSPHVVQILDHGVDEGVPFIVMELLDGESLASRLERQRRLAPFDTAHLMTQVARAMTKAHEAGIVHRDLKPDNIFIVRNDEEEIAKVLDFGVAKSHTHGVGAVSSATRTGSVLGTPYYMSPEQAEGSKSVDHRTDIWAMGVIAWECLLGARPFEAETLGGLLLAICAREMPAPSRMGAVPAGFDAWFARACSRDLNYRFATAKEAAAELRNVCAGQMMAGGYGAPPPVPQAAVQAASLPLASTTAHLGLSTSSPLPKKSAAPWVVMGVAAVAVVGGGALFALRGSNDQPEAGASAAPSAVTPPAPVAAAPPVAPEPEKPTPAPVASASAAPSATAAPAAVAPVAAAPRVKPRVGAAAVVEKPKPAAAPAPAPAQPPVKPRVNLGI